MSVFCDTFALVAWLHVRDAAHAAVRDYFRTCSEPIVVTEWVPVETVDALSKPPFRDKVAELLKRLRQDPQFEIVPYDWNVYRTGFDLFCGRNDKEWSLTDCISFGVMNERGITNALTADHHFTQAGFRAIFA